MLTHELYNVAGSDGIFPNLADYRVVSRCEPNGNARRKWDDYVGTALRARRKLTRDVITPAGARCPTPSALRNRNDPIYCASRSDERRVGQGCVSTCRSGWGP